MTLTTAPATVVVCQYVLVVVDVRVVKSILGAKVRRASTSDVEVTWIVVVYVKIAISLSHVSPRTNLQESEALLMLS